MSYATPLLETDRLILTPIQEADYDDMNKVFSDKKVLETMKGKLYAKFKKDLETSLYYDDALIIKKKDDNSFIGFICCYQFIDTKKSEIKYSQMWAALLPEYWGQGYCTEATKKMIHFAFVGMNTPWICVNIYQTNPAAERVLKKCGFTFHMTGKTQNVPYDQYRYIKCDYIKDNPEAEKHIYNYTFSVTKSPYSYDNPIRKIDSVTYVKEPTGYLCGQSVIAMLTNVPVDDVIKVMRTDLGTSTAQIDSALFYYGIKHGKTRKKVTKDTVLPDICILSLQLPNYGHWSLYFKGKYYDPEFGEMSELPENAVLKYFWEIFN